MGEEERLKDYIKSLSPYLYDEEHYLENDIEDVLNKLDLYKSVIEEVREDIVFCINGMKNEFACTDSRTNRELHTMVKILEDRLQILDKVKGE